MVVIAVEPANGQDLLGAFELPALETISPLVWVFSARPM
jgi:hypothetical protein